MTLSNLPPGVTDRMIEEQIGDDEQDEKPVSPFWTVAIYLVDRAYGGPEEGGWWYDCGERQDMVFDNIQPGLLLSVHLSEDDAIARCEFVQDRLNTGPNVGRREISSMASTGRYYAEVHRGYPPHHYPERTPHYE